MGTVARIVRRAPLQEVRLKIMDMSYRRVISTGLVCTLVTAVLSSPSGGLPSAASQTTNPSATQTAQQQVSSDAAFMARDGQGAFQRVWVSLDELMYWNGTTGYQGFNPRYLANLDDALARFHANGIKVDLMLYGASKGT